MSRSTHTTEGSKSSAIKTDLLARAYLDILAREEGAHSKPMLRAGSGDPADPVEILLEELMDTPAEERVSVRPDLAAVAVLTARAIEAEQGLTRALRRGAPVVTIGTHNHDMISVQQAAAKYRVARKSLSALASRNIIASIRPVGKDKLPRLVSHAEVAKLVQQKELAVSNSEVAVRLGIPRVFVTELGSCGLITPVEKPYLASRGREYFERCSLDLLERRCRGIARKDTPPESGVSIEVAARSLGIQLANPWPQIVESLLASKLQVWFAERKSLMRSLVIENIGALGSLRIRGVPTARADAMKLPLTDAAALIGTNTVKLAQLTARGFLPRDPTPQDLRSFIAEYMFTSEIQRLLERRGTKLRWREVPSLFRKSGVYPATALIDARGFVWPRRDVLAVIEQLRIAAS